MMLQAALLLLGCALSRYLWEINTTVASVVIGVTSSGVLFYLFIVVAGAAFVSCPYQTPGAQILRGILDALHPVFSAFIKESDCCKKSYNAWSAFKQSPCSLRGITVPLLIIPALILWLIVDAYRLGRAMVRGSVSFVCGVYSQLRQGTEHRTDVLDMCCILWAYQTSLDIPVRASVLNYLAPLTPANFDPSPFLDCFDVLVGCVKVTNGHVAIAQGMEQFARGTALFCLKTLSHLSATDPKSRVPENIRQRYITTFPFETNYDGLPFSHTLRVIHRVIYQSHKHQLEWGDCKLLGYEYTTLAHPLTELARFQYHRNQRRKVSRWLLRFALHVLSQDPLPPTSAVADCLSIIALDLDCTFPNTTTPDERCVHICQMSASLINY